MNRPYKKTFAHVSMTLTLLALAPLSFATHTSVAVGGYGDVATFSYFPMLMTSRYGQNNWVYQIEKGKNLPKDFGVTGFFESVNCSGPLCTAGGYYRAATDGYTYPMLAVSQDGGKYWDYMIEYCRNLPKDFDSTTIYSYGFETTSNSDQISVAGGVYPTGVNLAYPMLAVSTDGGKSWNYEIEKDKNLPADMKPGTGRSIESVSCTNKGQLCAAGSVYTVDGTPYTFNYPTLVVSTHYGKHWQYKVDNTNNLPKDYNYSEDGFLDVSCSGHTCAAGGAYTASTDNVNFYYYPMLLVSTNGGHDWKYKVENQNLPKHFSYTYSGFVDVSCSGRFCAAVGEYSATDGMEYPMLMMSTDWGHHWKYKVEIDKNLPHDFITGVFQNVSCSYSLCTASGTYESTDGKIYPMLVVSKDGGNTWKYKIKRDKNLPSNYSNTDYSEFQNVNCSTKRCTAGGYYKATNGNQYPMLVESTNGGYKWSYKVDSSTNLPNDFTDYGTFLGTSAGSK